MEENIEEIIKMIKKMAMENLFGMMEKDIKDFGKMENKMEKGRSFLQLIKFGKRVFGKKEKE